MADNAKDKTSKEAELYQPALLEDLIQREPNSAEIWYGHSILTSTLFPATAPAPGTDYVSKSNGSVEYMLEAGIDPITHSRQFPYGKYPRLIMSWIAKQIRAAGKRKTQHVDPENRTITIPSISQLCDEMGVAHGGRSQKAVQEQLRLLLSCRISVRRIGGFKYSRITDTVYMPLVEAVRTVESNRAELSGAVFVLTEEVFKRLGSESAPYDTRASSYLLKGRSVLPYDVYVWLTGSMKSLSHPLPVSWDWLYERFGDSIGTRKNFIALFRRALRKVLEVYPFARVEDSRKGLILYPSPTAIESRAAVV